MGRRVTVALLCALAVTLASVGSAQADPPDRTTTVMGPVAFASAVSAQTSCELFQIGFIRASVDAGTGSIVGVRYVNRCTGASGFTFGTSAPAQIKFSMDHATLDLTTTLQVRTTPGPVIVQLPISLHLAWDGTGPVTV